MSDVLSFVHQTVNRINSFVWGLPSVILILFVGIYITVRTGFFQFAHLKHWLKVSLSSVFSKEKSTAGISSFQALCTALASSIGTGNIAGVAVALSAGGPGAIFWMWVSAFFGMMTAYAENVLGIYFKSKSISGTSAGGPMYYICDGLRHQLKLKVIPKILAVLFCVFCIGASFGMGNLVQINSITESVSGYTHTNPTPIAVAVAVIISFVIIGGITKIGKVTGKLVPFMALGYILVSLFVLVLNRHQLPGVFKSIFVCAFGQNALYGGIFGFMFKKCVEIGFRRGIFSNEAGIGSSALAHSASTESEPAVQGMLGIFAVFTDTIVVCSLTAFVLLSCRTDAVSLETALSSDKSTTSVIYLSGERDSGDMMNVPLISHSENQLSGYTNVAFLKQTKSNSANYDTSFDSLGYGHFECQKIEGSELVTFAFFQRLGKYAGMFVMWSTFLFALSSMIGWAFYGIKAWEYIFGSGYTFVYKFVYVLLIVFGAKLNMDFIWDLSDCFNGLMAIPNLTAVVLLSGTVLRITHNYKERKFKGKNISPLVSFQSISNHR